MKCEDADKLMIDYLDGNLEDDLRVNMELHLGTCERCLDEIRSMKEVFTLISDNPNVMPDERLRINFYHMLHGEINRTAREHDKMSKPFTINRYSRLIIAVAAGFAILVTGTFLGILIAAIGNSGTAGEISQLRSEVSDLKKTAMIRMLSDESTSDRIQAVGFADEFDKPDQNIINALVLTLNNDRNVNVRLAAAYALSKYADQRQVCDSLVKSLSLQDEPILQVTLINILADRKEKSALPSIEKIIANEKTMKEVRDVAKNSLRILAL